MSCVTSDAGLALRLLHVDAHLLVIDKPAGMLSVPGKLPDHLDATSALRQRFNEIHIVHRLDQATSGLMVFARDKSTERHLSKQFQARTVHKRYEALVQGVMGQDHGHIHAPLITDWPMRPLQKIDDAEGKPSHTEFHVLARDSNANTTRVSLIPHTGRTHQLRVHLAHFGHPIVGDQLYNGPAAARMMLQATELAFDHPASAERLFFTLQAAF
jgi:tRNA pseudouridine32 synthase / 23S rRNA pseudouridine746 synthase